MKKIGIIGAGISGLTLAYYLKKKFQDKLIVHILEKEKRVGGWIRTNDYYGQIFECGPHCFREDEKGALVTELANDLDLKDSLIEASPTSKRRLVARSGKLCELPTSITSLFTSRLGRTLLKASILEPLKPKSDESDESVESFFRRRFNTKFVNAFIDPYVTGIYGGSATSLSMNFAFPKLWEIEQNKRSLVLSMLFNKTKSSHKIYTFKEGMEILPKQLEKRLHENIHLQVQVEKFKEHKDSVEVQIKNSETRCYDHIFSTLPPRLLTQLIPHDDPLKSLLPPVPMNTLLVVHLGFKSDFSNVRGFGFLAGRTEEAMLLGIIFDSDCFPQQNSLYKTRLSVFLGGASALHLHTLSDDAVIEHAYTFVHKYLAIHEDAAYASVFKAPYAIPHYPVGHLARLQELNRHLENRRITLLGAGLLGASLSDCVSKAKEVAENFSICK